MLQNAFLKHLTLQFLPEFLLQRVRKSHYSRKLLESPSEPEMEVIPHLLGTGGCAIDLGANFGLYTRRLSQIVGPGGCVHAVEPVPSTFDVLESNVRRLGMSNVTVHNLAVTDCERLVTMAVPKYAEGGENLYEARVVDSAHAAADRTVCVPAKRLDDLFGRLGRIDFIKCDVEAHELSVLRGASEILRIHRPAWLMEVSGNPDKPESTAAEVVALVAKAGYRVYHLDRGETRPRVSGDRASNYFLLRAEHVRRLASLSS